MLTSATQRLCGGDAPAPAVGSEPSGPSARAALSRKAPRARPGQSHHAPRALRAGRMRGRPRRATAGTSSPLDLVCVRNARPARRNRVAGAAPYRAADRHAEEESIDPCRRPDLVSPERLPLRGGADGRPRAPRRGSTRYRAKGPAATTTTERTRTDLHCLSGGGQRRAARELTSRKLGPRERRGRDRSRVAGGPGPRVDHNVGVRGRRQASRSPSAARGGVTRAAGRTGPRADGPKTRAVGPARPGPTTPAATASLPGTVITESGRTDRAARGRARWADGLDGRCWSGSTVRPRRCPRLGGRRAKRPAGELRCGW